MNPSRAADLRALLLLTRPHALLLGALLFGLGAAIADYLGQQVRPSQYLAGQGCVSALQLAGQSLLVFFDNEGDRRNAGRRITLGRRGGPSSIGLSRSLLLGIGGLTATATLASVLLSARNLPPIAGVILFGGSLGALVYSTPPLRLAHSGYGELAAALLLAAGIPSFAFTLFTGDLDRLILVATAPLVTILFAVLLAIDLENYRLDPPRSRRSLMVRIGWRLGMRIHDVALLVAYLLVVAGLAAGAPRRVGVGILLTLPLAGAQAWYLGRLRAGAPARWQLLRSSSYSLIGLATYMELSGFLLS